MRGSPLLRAFLALLVMGLLGWPVSRLLQARDEATPGKTGVAAPASLHAFGLQVSFTAQPRSYAVRSLGEVVLARAPVALEDSAELSLNFPPEGIELEFSVRFPPGQRGAARVHLTDPAGREYTRYLFGEGEVTDVLSFP